MNDKEFETMMKKVDPQKDSKEQKPRAITCPICGRKEIAFVTEWHKCIGWRIISTIILAIIIFCAIDIILQFSNELGTFITASAAGTPPLNTTSDNKINSPIALFIIIYLIVKIIINYIESKTHVKAICRDCGHMWLLD